MRRTALLLASTALVVLLASGVAFAADEGQVGTAAATGTAIFVNSTGDGTKRGNCTLREAITTADTNAKIDRCRVGSATERDVIRFERGERATIVLASQLPTINDPSGLTINGQKAKIRISGNERVRVFAAKTGAELALLKLTVADGRISTDTTDNEGGGISIVNATVEVRNTTFTNNSANFGGGGIFNSGTLTVTNSTFSENDAKIGGGIFNNAGGTLTVSNSTFSKNIANAGGGIYHDGPTPLTVTNSTFSENSADVGGGILNNYAVLAVTNSTFSENSADDRGSSIFNGEGTATLRNTIVASSSSGDNCSGAAIADGGYNIDSGTSCGFSEQLGSLSGTNPLLADQPAFNGGPTKTIALLEDSPAINAIPEATNGCGTEVQTDQRGVARPQGEGCDIGAFEKKVVRR